MAARLKKPEPQLIPIIRVNSSYDRFDTGEIFKGMKTRRTYQGDSREEYEVEAIAAHGCFYAYSADALVLETRTAYFTNKLLRQFPDIQVLTRGDDGQARLLVPLPMFREVGQFAGIKHRRKLTEEQRLQAVERLQRARATIRPTDSSEPVTGR